MRIGFYAAVVGTVAALTIAANGGAEPAQVPLAAPVVPVRLRAPAPLSPAQLQTVLDAAHAARVARLRASRGVPSPLPIAFPIAPPPPANATAQPPPPPFMSFALDGPLTQGAQISVASANLLFPGPLVANFQATIDIAEVASLAAFTNSFQALSPSLPAGGYAVDCVMWADDGSGMNAYLLVKGAAKEAQAAVGPSTAIGAGAYGAHGLFAFDWAATGRFSMTVRASKSYDLTRCDLYAI